MKRCLLDSIFQSAFRLHSVIELALRTFRKRCPNLAKANGQTCLKWPVILMKFQSDDHFILISRKGAAGKITSSTHWALKTWISSCDVASARRRAGVALHALFSGLWEAIRLEKRRLMAGNRSYSLPEYEERIFGRLTDSSINSAREGRWFVKHIHKRRSRTSTYGREGMEANGIKMIVS